MSSSDKARKFITAVLLLAVGACARATPPPKMKVADMDPGPLGVRWRLPSRFVDGRTGTELTREALFERIMAARVIYVGEQHTSPHDHAVQAEILNEVIVRGATVSIGLEMVKRPFQKWLSDYTAGAIDEAKFIERTEWSRRWGFDFDLYRPFLELARQHRLPAFALNARDEITRKVAREGIDSLDPVDRETVVDLDFDIADHRAMVKAVFDRHDMGSMTFENFYTAQLIWDETMAYEVALGLQSLGADAKMVVFAGSGHVRFGFGIPDRAAKRGAEPFVTVMPVMEEDGVDELVKDGVADLLWVMDR